MLTAETLITRRSVHARRSARSRRVVHFLIAGVVRVGLFGGAVLKIEGDGSFDSEIGVVDSVVELGGLLGVSTTGGAGGG